LRFLFIFVLTLTLSIVNAQKLLINEISQGVSGNREFVELIVNTANPGQCLDENECVDIRGWIFDDNNGYFSNNVFSGTGFAQGSMRFSNDAVWSCMKPGTLILLYDVSTENTSIPPQDLSTSDGNCKLVIPITSNLFERHETRPNASNNTYSNTGWLSGGNWSYIAMQNDDDSFQIIDPTTLLPVHAVSYGNNTFNNFIYFPGAAGGLAYQCVNSISNDFFDQSNWISTAAANQSPGVYNSVENEQTINSINAICGDPFIATITTTDDECGGTCDGTASLTLSGGTLPYGTPNWSTSETTNNINNLCEGAYSVSVSDNAGCTKIIDFTINSNGVPSQIQVSNNVTICEGETISLTASGPSNVIWNPGGVAGLTISVSPTNTTTYTVIDQNPISCFTENEVTVSVNQKPTISLITAQNPSACGTTDGFIEINGSGTGTVTLTGTNSGSFNVSSFPFTIPNLGGGVFSIVFQSSENCNSNELNVNLIEPNAPPAPTITVNGNLSFCVGESVELISSSTSNNVWSNGATTQSITVTTAGNYSVTVTENGCSATSTISQVIVNNLPIVNAGSDVLVCEGEQVTLNASGAQTYTWDNGITNGQAFLPSFGLGGVDFTVIGTDANGCQNTDQVLVFVNPLPFVNVGNNFNICVNNSSFELTAFENIAGGIWSYNGTAISTTFNPSIFGIGSHSLTYTYTDPSTSCSNSANKIIQVNALPPIEAGSDVSVCEGNSVTLNATGSAGFSWSNGVVNGVPFTPISSTIYTVSVTDGNNCSNSDIVAVTVVPTPNVFAGLDLEVCGNMEITLSGSGASTYLWDDGVIDGVPFVPISTQTYTVIGTDDIGCFASDQVTISVNPLASFDLGDDYVSCNGTPTTLTIPNVYERILWSNGSTSNTLNINESGIYEVTAWNNGANIILNGNFNGGTTAQSNNFSTSYTTGVMGAFGLLTDAGTYAISTSPSLVHFNFANCGDHTSGNGNMLVCNGSNIPNTPVWCQTVAVQPNTDYNFSCWVMNAITSADVAQLQFFINGVQIGNVFSTSTNSCNWQEFFNLWNSEGNTIAELCIYNQNTVDGGNDFAIDDIYFSPICSIKDAIEVTIENITLNAGTDQTICLGESLVLDAETNIGGNTEEISFTNSVSLPIFDNFQTPSSISVSGINSSVPTSIARVCLNITHTWTADLDISLQCPNGTIIDLSSDNGGSGQNYTNTCFTSIGPSITSGTAPFTGNFSPEQSFDLMANCTVNGTWTLLVADDGAGDVGSLLNWTITFNNELPGNNFSWTPLINIINENTLNPTVSPTETTTYTFSVISPSGNCNASDDVTVFVGSGNQINAGNDISICIGESVTLTASGGQNYQWNNGVIDGAPFSPTQTQTYTVTSDATNSCGNSDEVIVTVNQLPFIQAINNISLCENDSPINLNANPSGGTWQGNGITNTVTGVFDPSTVNLNEVNTITYSLTDVNSCSNNTSFIIIVNALPQINAGNDVITCPEGTVTLNATGGVSYTWDNNVINGQAFSPSEGIYSVTGTDINGCSNTDDLSIVFQEVNLIPINDISICFGESANVETGSAENYIWSPSNAVIQNGANAIVFPQFTTNFKVIGEMNGCFDSITFLVTVKPLPTINAGNDTLVCRNESVYFNANSNTTDILWQNSFQNRTFFTPSQSGYLVAVANLNECENKDSIYVQIEEYPIMQLLTNFTDGCAPLTINFEQNSNGASTYLWEFGDNTTSTLENPIHTYNSSGYATVSLIATSLNGCKTINTYDSLIHAVQKPLAQFASSSSEIDFINSEVHFTNFSTFANNYIWNFNYGFTSEDIHPTHQFVLEDDQNVLIQLIAQASLNCFDTAYMVIKVKEKLIYYIPNAFTPNGDELNQTFKPVFYSGFNPQQYNLQIFNRWGELMFESNDSDFGWDGTYHKNEIIKSDSYVWKIRFETLDGEKIIKTGSVTLIR
jgi:gliding motility-associated-like protein